MVHPAEFYVRSLQTIPLFSKKENHFPQFNSVLIRQVAWHMLTILDSQRQLFGISLRRLPTTQPMSNTSNKLFPCHFLYFNTDVLTPNNLSVLVSALKNCQIMVYFEVMESAQYIKKTFHVFCPFLYLFSVGFCM